MQKAIVENPALFPLIFGFGWFFITTFLSIVSGWLSLMMQFTDRREEATRVFRHQSGSMRGISIRRLLRSVCPSGMRFGMNRLFGLFSRDFFVPWDQLNVVPVTSFFLRRTQFQFRAGASVVGTLTMAPEDVARIGLAAKGIAPTGMFLPPEPNRELGKRLFLQWLIATSMAAAFFTLVPRYVLPTPAASGAYIHERSASYPPWPVTVLFPAVVFGIVGIIAYVRARSKGNPPDAST